MKCWQVKIGQSTAVLYIKRAQSPIIICLLINGKKLLCSNRLNQSYCSNAVCWFMPFSCSARDLWTLSLLLLYVISLFQFIALLHGPLCACTNKQFDHLALDRKKTNLSCPIFPILSTSTCNTKAGIKPINFSRREETESKSFITLFENTFNGIC